MNAIRSRGNPISRAQRLRIGIGFLSVASLFTLGTPAAAAGKAALVDQVLPVTPFLRTLAAQTSFSPVDGVPSGRLGLTSLTITNFLSSPAYVRLTAVKVSGADCQSPVTAIDYDFVTTVYVQPTSTLNLTFPTPVVIGSGVGPACFQASTPFGGNVSVLAVGKSE